jgi:hypothetical protein
VAARAGEDEPKIVQLWTDDRIEALLAAMSWEEEPAQPQIGYRPRLADAVELVRGGIGAVFWPRSAVSPTPAT